MYAWKTTQIWGVSGTPAFSRHALERFIEGQQFDIFQTRQRPHRNPGRHSPSRALDLFGLDPVNLRAGVSILIHDTAQRGKGYAAGAWRPYAAMPRYAAKFSYPVMVQRRSWKCTSLVLFRNAGFQETGSGRSGCGCRRIPDEVFLQNIMTLRRFLRHHKTNPSPINTNSSGKCSEASPRLPMCQIRIFSTVETGTTLPEEVAYTRIVSPMA